MLSSTAQHFSFSGVYIAGNTSNPHGSRVTPVNVVQIPGLNTLGISLACIDYAPTGVVPPCTYTPSRHRGSNSHRMKFKNVGYGNAVSISALSSQNRGVITIANAVFGSKPGIDDDSFQGSSGGQICC
ncbi:hypothetical protein FNV43_RR07321 [Rhamnella rubrinervis]|uniref:Cupin type-1 domain-containing protein n=1 Tax=Rhamnella rubrinervis TaxID=2594499 RepID=A0A8K0HF21_9ROSA|nr:hypothetical protein FNV43_RR07321 [Rhamnella rubrinervis]